MSSPEAETALLGHLQTALAGSISSDPTVMKQAEGFLVHFGDHPLALKLGLTVLMQLQKRAAGEFQSGDTAGLESTMYVMMAAIVFLKNQSGRCWRELTPMMADEYHAETRKLVKILGGAQGSLVVAADANANKELLEVSKNFLLENLFAFVRDMWGFVALITGGDLSGMALVSSAPPAAAANTAGGRIEKKAKSVNFATNARLLLKHTEAIVNACMKYECPGNRAGVLISTHLVPVLERVAGGAQGAGSGADAQALELLLSNEHYAAQLLLKGMVKSQEYRANNNPADMDALCARMFCFNEKIAAALLALLAREREACGGAQAPAPGSPDRAAFLRRRCASYDHPCELLRVVLKSYHHAVYWTLSGADEKQPGYLMNSIRAWMEIVYMTVQRAIPGCFGELAELLKAAAAEQVTDERFALMKNKNRPAKVLKRALAIAQRFLAQHAKQTHAADDEEKQSGAVDVSKLPLKEQFARTWLEQYSVEFTKSILLTLNFPHLPPQIQNLVLRSLAAAVQFSVCFKFLKPELIAIMTKVCFPLISFSKDDLETWDEEPEEFVRNQMDILQVLQTPRGAARSFVMQVVKYRASAALLPILEFALTVLKSPSEEDPAQAEGAMHIVELLGPTVMKVFRGKDSTGGMGQIRLPIQPLDMLNQFVVPYLQSPVKFLRFRSLVCHASYAEGGVYTKEMSTCEPAKWVVSMMLQDSEWVVRTAASVQLQHYVKRRQEDLQLVNGVLKQTMQQILIQLVKTMEDFKCEELGETLRMLAQYYPGIMMPFLGELLEKIIGMLSTDMDGEEDDDNNNFHVMELFELLVFLVRICYKTGGNSSASGEAAPSDASPDKRSVVNKADPARQQTFAAAGEALLPVIAKVLGNSQFVDHYETVGELLSMVTKECSTPFSEAMMEVVAKGLHNVCVEYDVRCCENLQAQGPAVVVDVKCDEGCNDLEHLYVPLRNLMVRDPKTLFLEKKFASMETYDQVKGFVDSAKQGGVASLRVLSEPEMAMDPTTGQARTAKHISDDNKQFGKYENLDFCMQHAAGDSLSVTIFEILLDVCNAAFYQNTAESSFVFALIIAAFGNEVVKPIVSGEAEHAMRPYLLHKLALFVALLWERFSDKHTSVLLRKHFLECLLHMLYLFPQPVMEFFVAQGEQAIEKFLMFSVFNEQFRKYMGAGDDFSTSKQVKVRRSVFFGACSVFLNFFYSQKNEQGCAKLVEEVNAAFARLAQAKEHHALRVSKNPTLEANALGMPADAPVGEEIAGVLGYNKLGKLEFEDGDDDDEDSLFDDVETDDEEFFDDEFDLGDDLDVGQQAPGGDMNALLQKMLGGVMSEDREFETKGRLDGLLEPLAHERLATQAGASAADAFATLPAELAGALRVQQL